MAGGLQQHRTDDEDGEYGKERELETHIEEIERVGHQHDDGGQRQGVERHVVTMNHRHYSIDGNHDSRTHHTGRHAYHHHIRPDGGKEQGLTKHATATGTCEKREDGIDNTQVKTAQGEHMARSGNGINIACHLRQH